MCHIRWHNTHVSVSSLLRDLNILSEFNSVLIIALGFFFCHFVQLELYNFVFNFANNIENKDYFLGFSSLQSPLCYKVFLLPFQ